MSRLPVVVISLVFWSGIHVGAASADPVVVAAAGDIARQNAPGTPQTRTAALITHVIQPARVFALGDEKYQHGGYEQFLRSYEPTWGSFLTSTVPVPGNHEYETPRAEGYFRYFSSVLSGFAPTASDPSKGYYSFDVGDWHVVALNTNCAVEGISCSAEKTWLKQDLEADSHLCEVALAHHPNKAFAEILANKHADLLLTGHRHVYERWDRAFGYAIRELIVGTGGIGLGRVRSAADAEVREFGVARLELRATGYSWRFIDVAARTRDSGTAECRG